MNIQRDVRGYKSKPNKHGYPGVVYYKDRDIYYAKIHINGKLKYLGKAATAEEAGMIYKEAVIALEDARR